VAASAQTFTGSIRGVVRDAQGGALAGADVTITCGTMKRRVTTSASGEFAEGALPATRCTVSAVSEAFEPEATLVDARSHARAVLVLQVRRFASEVVVTPTRGVDQRSLNVPDAMSITTRRDIDSRPYTLLPQVLREEPGILLQQTTSAQISPIIRGFTGQSNVYLVDGVRLNTGQWRSGPSQYVSWVDGGPVDSIEVVRGGGSVQYGSDALGGTVQFLTTPTLIGAHSSRISGNVELSAATAAQSLSGQADLGLQAAGASLRFGLTRHNVGDLRGGEGLDSHSAITRFFGLPSTLLGTRMPATSFDQTGAYALANVGWRNGTLVRALYMHEAQAGANRYDRVMGGEGLYRSGFDPQTLDFGLVRVSRSDLRWVDGVSATFSVNRQADGRFEQARPTARLDRQTGTTIALGYQVQANREFTRHQQLVVGGELYAESIDAARELIDATGTQRARPDIPTGTTYRSYGVFAQHAIDVIPDRLTVRGGARVSGFRFATTADPALGVTEENVATRAMTFQVAGVAALMPGLNLTASVNRAFRAANAADFGSIGLSGGGGFEISPSTAAALGAYVGSTGGAGAVSTGERVDQLSPEVVYQYEVGLKASVGGVSAAVNGFDLELFDFIQRRALVFETPVIGTVISGFEVVRMDGTGLAYIAQDVRPIATRVNVDRARVRGFEAEGEWRVRPNWTTSAYFSMANGVVVPQGEYMRRMPPPLGGAKLRWSRDRVWTEGTVTFAARQTRFNSGDIGDARIGGLRTRTSIANFFNGTATDIGLVQNGVLVATGETLAQVQARVLGSATSAPLFTSHPGFLVYGLRGGVRITRALEVSAMAENLTDVNYRLYGSGLDAPGFNVQVRARYRF
jgi:outer membrane receptor protein involved in Fe transport